MQLQENAKVLKDAKIQVVAISYDSVEILAKFAEKANISFPLLSDAGSKTIDRWNLRNKDLKGKRIDGVPHPGTIIVGADGKVAAKLFYEGHRKRHVAKDIIEAATPLLVQKKQDEE